jgi:hypothetical protein
VIDESVSAFFQMGTRMRHLRPFALLAISLTAGAVVVRSDVGDAKYLVPASAFPALVDLPGEGHGVLIAPSWVVTAAHATQGYMLMRVWIHGEWRSVAHVFLYPGFEEEYEKVKRVAAIRPLRTGLQSSRDLNPRMKLLSSNWPSLLKMSSP